MAKTPNKPNNVPPEGQTFRDGEKWDKASLSAALGLIVWTALTVLAMLQFAHEVNLKMGLTAHDRAELAVETAEAEARKGNQDEASRYRRIGHALYQEMYRRFDNSKRLYPIEMETLYIEGRYCIDNDNPTRGVKVLVKDLFLNPNYKWAHNNLGVCFDRLEETPNARECYRRALMVDAYQVYAHFNLGIGFTRERRFAKAIPEFLATIESDRSKLEAYKYLAYCYQELDCEKMAIEALDAYERVYRKEASKKKSQIDKSQMKKDLRASLRSQWSMARDIGDVSAEAKYLEKILELDPSNAAHRKLLISKLQTLEDANRLAHHVREMVKYSPKDPYAWYNLAVMEAVSKRSEAALENLQKAIALGGETFIGQARRDAVFRSYHDLPEFKELIPD